MTKQHEQKKIAVVGTSPRTRDAAPYADDSWQIWAINHAYQFAPRLDRLYELHDLTETNEAVKMNDEHRDALKKLTCPIITQRVYDWLPTSQPYPLGDILRTFQSNYFTNSVSYLVAAAIQEGATDIAIYGVDMANRSEYGEQRPGCEYWIGLARGRGINVFIPDASDLCKTSVLYAFNLATSERKLFRENRKREMRGRIETITQEQEALIKTYQECKSRTDMAMTQSEVQKALLKGCLEEMLYEEARE